MENNSENFLKIVSEFTNKPVSELKLDAQLKSLVNDSFMLVELVMNLQEDLGVTIGQEDLRGVLTLEQLQAVFLSK